MRRQERPCIADSGLDVDMDHVQKMRSVCAQKKRRSRGRNLPIDDANAKTKNAADRVLRKRVVIEWTKAPRMHTAQAMAGRSTYPPTVYVYVRR